MKWKGNMQSWLWERSFIPVWGRSGHLDSGNIFGWLLVFAHLIASESISLVVCVQGCSKSAAEREDTGSFELFMISLSHENIFFTLPPQKEAFGTCSLAFFFFFFPNRIGPGTLILRDFTIQWHAGWQLTLPAEAVLLSGEWNSWEGGGRGTEGLGGGKMRLSPTTPHPPNRQKHGPICDNWKWVSLPSAITACFPSKKKAGQQCRIVLYKMEIGCLVSFGMLCRHFDSLLLGCCRWEKKKKTPASILDSGKIIPSLSVICFSTPRCEFYTYFYTSTIV